jgi:pimeloyl-ACP methyl ester carboxylesterase
VITRRAHVAIGLVALTLGGCHDPAQPSGVGVASLAEGGAADYQDSPNVATIDHWVPHVSTVSANAGELVHLFVRERVRSDLAGGEPRKVVLMVQGVSVPVLPLMELRYRDYDYALWLARSGDFDVFMFDLQGYGRSPRPKMDDPCNVPLSQQPIIPQDPPCAPSYPFLLHTIRSEWDELDAVVDFIRAQRGVEKVALIGASFGAVRVGPYAVQHPDKVESLLFYSPFYAPANPAGRAGTGDDGFGPPIDPRTGAPFTLPQPGTPMTLTTRAAFNELWNREIKCDGQVEDGIQDVVWNAIMDNDPIGRTWAQPEGVLRVRTSFPWGWNPATAARISVPSLLIHGALDLQVPATQSQLYDDLDGVPDGRRLSFTLECAGHLIGWERQRKALHHISKEWLKHGAVEGHTSGRFFVDTEGVIHPR